MSQARQTEILDITYSPTNATIAATPKTVATSNTVVISANTKRQYVILQNVGTNPVLLRLGAAASAANYNYVLSKGTGAKDGLGGELKLTNYQGAIHGITEASSTVISITEMVKE